MRRMSSVSSASRPTSRSPASRRTRAVDLARRLPMHPQGGRRFQSDVLLPAGDVDGLAARGGRRGRHREQGYHVARSGGRPARGDSRSAGLPSRSVDLCVLPGGRQRRAAGLHRQYAVQLVQRPRPDQRARSGRRLTLPRSSRGAGLRAGPSARYRVRSVRAGTYDPAMVPRPEAEELLLIEEADAWFEYLEATRAQSALRYKEVEPWAWARLSQRLRAVRAKRAKLRPAAEAA